MDWNEQLIHQLEKKDRLVQNRLYDEYSPVLLGIIRRYLNRIEDAEEVLIDTFTKIFTKIDSFGYKGSFEGWMKRIAVNESLMFLRKKNKVYFESTDDIQIAEPDSILPKIQADEIIELLDELPTGYRTVFNLYLIEGLKHREIAEKLDISIETSKSQYRQAKMKMAELIKIANNE